MQLPSSSPVARRVAISALFASLALIFSYIEAILPAAPGIPGIKLGIANLVVIIAMYRLDSRYALTINLIRIFLAGFMFSGLYGAIYSLCGCILNRSEHGRRCRPQHRTAVYCCHSGIQSADLLLSAGTYYFRYGFRNSDRMAWLDFARAYSKEVVLLKKRSWCI